MDHNAVVCEGGSHWPASFLAAYIDSYPPMILHYAEVTSLPLLVLCRLTSTFIKCAAVPMHANRLPKFRTHAPNYSGRTSDPRERKEEALLHCCL